MDDTEDPYAEAQGFESSQHPKIRVLNASYPSNVGDQYVEGDDDTEVDERNEEEEEEEGDRDEEDIIQLNGKAEDVSDEDDVIELNGKAEDVSDEDDVIELNGKAEDVSDEDEDANRDGDESDHDDENDPNDYRRIESADQHRQPKKRKMKSLLSSYEFAPRVPAPVATTRSVSKPSHGGRNALSDWTEHETFVLLDAWGDRFLQRGRKSLRSEEWQEVAEKVSQESRLERTDTQCRNRLDTLKKKYKKEKMKLQEMMDTTSKWVYFKKMNMLLSSTPQQPRLSRRVNSVNSGEYVSQYTRVPLNRACRIDELSNSPEISESVEAEENNSDLLPPKRTNRGDGGSFRLLAESITKFSDIYEKIESSKRKQMLELERMRMDFFRELEMQKRQILERARAEIASIRRGDDERNDGSAENFSG
ncbi:trihelix transcription factor ASIL2-like [Heracleum sosnowskyi]|uniref:Trihelix transcription factor ASIL2-like n=1 Tax=Heracleum sosnowskyi TaxID=360622 RepID=A0AAD8HAU0_9APIA|nr:trihelix transcription factor ASIL2-like [Heracleum sosnowskyi]